MAIEGRVPVGAMFRHVGGRGTKVNQDSEASSDDESFGQLNLGDKSPEVEDESDIGESDEDDDSDVEEKPAKASKGSASKPTKIKNEPETVHKAIPLLLVQLHNNIHLQFNPILMLGPAEDKLLAPPGQQSQLGHQGCAQERPQGSVGAAVDGPPPRGLRGPRHRDAGVLGRHQQPLGEGLSEYTYLV